MANPEQVAKLKQHWNPLPGVPESERWNRWRLGNPGIIPDLTGADLCNTILNNADLRGADLRNALFGSTNLRNAALRGSDLTGANLTGADFINADLRGADMSGTILFATTFANTNMRDVKGLETCIHKAPSSVGLDTFFRSNGEIPDTFLRGCGVPEHFITYARSLIGQPIEFYSCFISYSSHDQVFAERLHADLRAKNLHCWFAPEDLKIGDRFQETIEESIRIFDKVIIVLSEASAQSRWVEREVNAAYERENRENRSVLFPICIDDAVWNATQPWAADIRRTRHIGDFRAWEIHSNYLKGFGRLLRDLKAT